MSVLLMMPCRPSAFLSRSVGGLRRLFSAEISIPLKTGLLPFSPPPYLLPLSFLSSFPLPSSIFLSLPPHSLPHSLSGRAIPEGPIQRVMAAAETSNASSFHSESRIHFGGPGLSIQQTACRLWRGTSMCGRLLPTSFWPPPLMGASVNIHGGSLPKPLVCLWCLMGTWHGGGVGPWSAKSRCTFWSRWLPAILSRPVCWWRLEALHGWPFGCFLALQEVWPWVLHIPWLSNVPYEVPLRDLRIP